MKQSIQAETSKKSVDDRTIQEPVVPSTEEVTGLIEFKESANSVTEKINGFQKLAIISNPFTDQTPSEVLKRSYTIAQFDWTPSNTFLDLAFPSSLFAVETIANFLSNVEYLRAGVRITVRMNSTPYHQGLIAMSVIPCRGSANVTTYQKVNARPLLLSASVQDSGTIDLPYLNPLSWLDITTCANYAIGTFFLQTINPLLVTAENIPNSVSITIFAAFLDPQVAGYIEPSAAREKRKHLKWHPDNPKRVKQYKLIGVAQSSNERQIRMTNSKAQQCLVKTNFPNPAAEAEEKAEKGVTTKGIQKVVGGASEILKMVPVIGPIWSGIAKFISTFGSVLDKPWDPSNHITVDLAAVTNEHCNVSGLFKGASMTMYQAVQTSKDGFGMETSYSTISAIAQLPSLYSTMIFASNGDSLVLGCTPLSPGTYNANGVDWFSYVAMPHTFWRGSIKFWLQFVNNAFYSARFRIFYATSTPSSADGDLPQMIVDVKGDTSVDVMIPYLHPLVWRPVGLTYAVGDPKLYIQMITEIAGATMPAAPVIYLNVWRSAGEDIQFMLPRNPYFNYHPALKNKKSTKEPVGNAQTCLGTRFKKPFNPISPGACQSMEFGTCQSEIPIYVSDEMKRWSTLPTNIMGSLAPGWDVSFANVNADYATELFPYYSQLFLFCKGSRRFRIFSTASDFAFLGYNGLPLGTGGDSEARVYTLTNTAGSPLNIRHNDIEVPWISQVPYIYVDRDNSIPYTTQFDPPVGLGYKVTGGFNPDSLCWAAGDDFQFLYLYPPVAPPA